MPVLLASVSRTNAPSFFIVFHLARLIFMDQTSHLDMITLWKRVQKENEIFASQAKNVPRITPLEGK